MLTSFQESNTEGRSQEDSDAAVSAKDEARLAERIGVASSVITPKQNGRLNRPLSEKQIAGSSNWTIV
ncbi:Major facilitator-type transporter ecdD [Fusarium oxysporum f. sp. albedinis]|nr:Major facilitator-type transporter ecdD [Fusarium oxysporum f. sp. albedinis]